ncbi:hypothetical protein PYW08_012877 [Mythimna loreyi]|uniref:Uncharacterized protein n=1 Tax=Mythimna loreyi TaxID=667449 RepID=A0ACC2Q3A2_9NEOP|nr:hypothetical protein PYW08_012877 [Mythimna loreyi]
MSLIFRKAIVPKNVSLLKYFKGRPLATAANKKNNGVLSTAVPCHRNLKYKARPLRVGIVKPERAKPLTSFKIEGRGEREATRLRFCASSPDIVPLSRTRIGGSPISGPASSINYDSLLLQRTGSLPNVPCSYFHTADNVAKCAPACKPCPCPCGCPGCCSCLPPPCNTPPKCIQYMTGYYYYPYGFWFCGPYHVTGTCVPSGPCSPGGPCGPCCGPPCPPCGPCCGPCPCAPCPPPKPPCPCPKCCTCLSPISTAVVGGDPEPRCQSVQTPPTNPKSNQLEANYPLPRDEPPQRERGPPQSKGGISKFFPFNAVPALVPALRAPHASVHVCPYSTQPLTQSCPQTQYSGCTRLFPEHNPVYCTPCIKARTRPRQPPSYYFTDKAKKCNYYERRSETRSPIYHKRVKRVNCELCPVLENPRVLPTKEQRDRPATLPGTFQYSNIPNFKNPFPSPNKDSTDYREFET